MKEITHPGRMVILVYMAIIGSIITFTILISNVEKISAANTLENDIQQIVEWLETKQSDIYYKVKVSYDNRSIELDNKRTVLRLNIKHFQTLNASGEKQYIQWNFVYRLYNLGLRDWWKELVLISKHGERIALSHKRTQETTSQNWRYPEKDEAMKKFTKEVNFWLTQIPKTGGST